VSRIRMRPSLPSGAVIFSPTPRRRCRTRFTELGAPKSERSGLYPHLEVDDLDPHLAGRGQDLDRRTDGLLNARDVFPARSNMPPLEPKSFCISTTITAVIAGSNVIASRFTSRWISRSFASLGLLVSTFTSRVAFSLGRHSGSLILGRRQQPTRVTAVNHVERMNIPPRLRGSGLV